MGWINMTVVLVGAYFAVNAIIAVTMANGKKEFFICLFVGVPIAIMAMGAMALDDWRNPEEEEGW